jgi:regulator of protease activity HflC (stomatin/prohibitin superfamily)
MREKLWARKPFSVNDLVCDESGNPVKTEIDSWLIEVKAYIEALEAELKDAKVQRRIDSDHRAMYCNMKNEAVKRAEEAEAERDAIKRRAEAAESDMIIAESRLAEAETSLKIANEGLNTTNKISDELQSRLTEAEKLIEKWRHPQNACNYTYEILADELEKAIRGEAEG